MSRKLVLYIAMSLDGYIAKHDGNLDFLSLVEAANEDYGYSEFLGTVDTIIWGRKTYDKVLSFGGAFPHSDKKVYVISKSRTGKDEHVEFSSDPAGLVKSLKEQEGKDIYCDGGAEIVFDFLNHKLFDHLIISVIPHLLGTGIRLFKDGFPEHDLSLKRSIAYPSGLIQLAYDIRK